MTTEPGRELLPVACTLGPSDGGQRVADWQGIAERAGAGQQVAAGKVTLLFRDLPGVGGDLERLVSAERLCCAFLGWDLIRAAGQWHVKVTGSDDDLRSLPLGG